MALYYSVNQKKKNRLYKYNWVKHNHLWKIYLFEVGSSWCREIQTPFRKEKNEEEKTKMKMKMRDGRNILGFMA